MREKFAWDLLKAILKRVVVPKFPVFAHSAVTFAGMNLLIDTMIRSEFPFLMRVFKFDAPFHV